MGLLHNLLCQCHVVSPAHPHARTCKRTPNIENNISAGNKWEEKSDGFLGGVIRPPVSSRHVFVTLISLHSRQQGLLLTLQSQVARTRFRLSHITRWKIKKERRLIKIKSSLLLVLFSAEISPSIISLYLSILFFASTSYCFDKKLIRLALFFCHLVYLVFLRFLEFFIFFFFWYMQRIVDI